MENGGDRVGEAVEREAEEEGRELLSAVSSEALTQPKSLRTTIALAGWYVVAFVGETASESVSSTRAKRAGCISVGSESLPSAPDVVVLTSRAKS